MGRLNGATGSGDAASYSAADICTAHWLLINMEVHHRRPENPSTKVETQSMSSVVRPDQEGCGTPTSKSDIRPQTTDLVLRCTHRPCASEAPHKPPLHDVLKAEPGEVAEVDPEGARVARQEQLARRRHLALGHRLRGAQQREPRVRHVLQIVCNAM